MRRSSSPIIEEISSEDLNVGEFDSKLEYLRIKRFLESSPQFQRDFDKFYNNKAEVTTDSVISNENEPLYQRQLVKRMKVKCNNDSLQSLTDSEFYSDDQIPRRSSNDRVVYGLSRVGRFLDMMSRLPLPKMSFTALGLCFLIGTFISPRACVQNILFPSFRLVFGTLYPAYASYKAVRTKNVKEYVKWMMYWIVYAFFTCIETFTDIFLSWFPFYYEVKVLVVLWLLSPATKGSSVLYRKFVHPMLTRREQEIDEYLNQAKERGYTAVIQLGSKGVNYATNVIMQTAIKGGGNLVNTIRRSYSLSDLSEPDDHRTQDEVDEVVRPTQQTRTLRAQQKVARSSSGSRHSSGMYFSEIDSLHIRSSEDISSGYSSAEPTNLSRTSSMTNANRLRFKAKRTEEKSMSVSCTTLPRTKKNDKTTGAVKSRPKLDK